MANQYMGVPTMYGGYDPYGIGAPYSYPSQYRTPYNSPYGATTQPPVGQQIPQQQPTQGQALQCIQVPNADYAKSVVLNPNQTLYMVSQNAPELYAKAADSMGVATMKYFKLVEFDPTIEAAQQALNNQIGNVVSRDEFNAFANSVQTQFNALQSGFVNQGNVSVQSTVQPDSIPPVVTTQQEISTTKQNTSTTKKKEATTA